MTLLLLLPSAPPGVGVPIDRPGLRRLGLVGGVNDGLQLALLPGDTIQDLFDRANGPLGANWTITSRNPSIQNGAWGPLDNSGVSDPTAAALAGWTGTVLGDNQWAEASVSPNKPSGSGTGPKWGIWLRRATSGTLQPRLEILWNSSPTRFELKIDGPIGARDIARIPWPTEPVAGDVWRLEVYGTVLRFLFNGSVKLMASTTARSSGMPGIVSAYQLASLPYEVASWFKAGTLTTPIGGYFANDTFTEASDLTLASHVGETGATWTIHPSYSGTATVNASLDTLLAATTSETLYYASGDPASANYRVQGLVVRKSNLGMAGVAGRIDPVTKTYYRAYHDTPNNLWRLEKVLPGGVTSLGTSAQVLANDDVASVALDMNGTTITMLVDGTSLVSVTDSAISAAGKMGVYLSSASAMTSTTGIHLDSIMGIEAGVLP